LTSSLDSKNVATQSEQASAGAQGGPASGSDANVDILIIGAGVSGLAAARKLCDAGLYVKIIEARGRIGGRIFTHHDPLSALPFELGAEFIHGKPRETLELLEHAGLGTYHACDSHFHLSPGGPKKADSLFAEISEVFEKLRSDGTDRSFADFLKSQPGLKPELRDLATAYVEGFHASDARLISEHALAFAEKKEPDQTDQEADVSLRPYQGYDRIPQLLYQALSPQRSSLHLNTVVREIHWRPKRVDVLAALREGAGPRQYSAPRALITLPWGVLHAHHITGNPTSTVRLLPEPATFSAAATAVRMGAAIRIVLNFRERFWDHFLKENIGYLHGDSSCALPVWWSPLPSRAPVWTGWVGGPKAEALGQLDEGRILDKAIESLAKLLSCTRGEVSRHLQSWHYHDWLNDPFARGAYSYVAVGGEEAALGLSSPVEGTIYFAGEATQNGASRGTVHGAIASGYRAADQILSELL
jgi:monoamine oxidase